MSLVIEALHKYYKYLALSCHQQLKMFLNQIKSNQIKSLFESGKSPYTDTHTHTQNTIYNKRRRNYETVEKKLDQ